jgi:nuclear pore complex protein Nup98-Nup96
MPYPSKRRRFSASNMNENDAAFHDSFKPAFSGHNALVYSVPGSAPKLSGDMKEAIKPLVSEGRDVRFAKFTALEDVDSQSLELQRQHTELQQRGDEQMEVPQAITPAEISFATLTRAQTGASSLEVHEKAIWELCSILFDPLDVCAGDLLDNMSDEQIAEYEPRLRLDRFQTFWAQLVSPLVDSRVNATRSAEEKALLLLTKGDVITACQLLMDAGNVKLATLVAQLPGSDTSREVMKQQVQMWQERKDWSEFSDAHKALYSILAGETCMVAGLAGASEDRTKQFCLSERFGLDWRQSLALCMQFGGHETIVNAVSSYIANLRDGREKVKPLSSNAASETENTLLGLLRLYALKEAQVEQLFDSATVSGSALNSRLAWQLATVLEAKDLCDFPDDKMDALTLDFASQLESAGAWTKAAWILLHLGETSSRTIAIQGLLERNAAQLPSPDLDQDNTLMEDDSNWSLSSIAIPTSLIWSAKAVYAHAVLREPALQAKWLLYTNTEEAFAEAHTVLCSTVGPRAVIEKDYTDLTDLLACFDAHGATDFGGWKHGGKIYADFVRLNALSEKQKTNREGRNTCWVLRKGLEGAQQDELVSGGGNGKSLEVRVAMGEIFRVLSEVEREIGVNPRFSFGEGMDVDGEGERGGRGLLDGYRKALGVVV